MLALGADWCNAARGFMFALGCIQAQTCHTGHCPTGVTTQDPQRQQALDVPSKADRVYHFHQNTLLALKELVQAAGLQDPAGITADHIVRRHSEHGVKLLANLLPFVKPGELLDGESHAAGVPHLLADGQRAELQRDAACPRRGDVVAQADGSRRRRRCERPLRQRRGVIRRAAAPCR